jgi:transposase
MVTQHVVGDDMPAPYSGDLRERVAAAVGAGASARSAAGRFGVSVSTAIRWAQRWRTEGHAQPRAMGGDHRSRLVEHRPTVLELLAKQPDLTLQEIRGALAGHGISIGLSSLWRFLKAQNITLKKRASMPPSRIAPTSPRSGGSSSVASPRSIPTA